jgi:cell division protease FtsH
MGPVSYNDAERYMLDNREITSKSERSEATAVTIDTEVKKIIDSCYEETKKILESNREALEGITEGLLMYESLDAAEVDEILQGKKPEDLKDLLLDDIMDSGDDE